MVNNPTNFANLESVARSILSLMIRVKEQSYRYCRKLENWQWLSRSDVQQLQKERLEKILLHAYHYVPYYRKGLKSAGVIKNSDQVKLYHFENIPLLDKNKIHYHFDDLKSDDLASRKWYENAYGRSPCNVFIVLN